MTHDRIKELMDQLSEAQSERDALQARVDGAVDRLKKHTCYSAVAHAIEILTGEGE